MDDHQLEALSKRNIQQITTILTEFNNKHEKQFNFFTLRVNNQWYSLWCAIFSILSDEELSSLRPLCLSTVRILTRDEQSLNEHVIDSDVNKLCKLANLTNDTLSSPAGLISNSNIEIVAEALKCLCNLVFQSAECRRFCLAKNTCAGIVKRVATYMQHEADTSTVQLYDMKLLFLLTALEPSARNTVQIDCNGIVYLTEWLHEKLLSDERDLGGEQIDVLVEILKILFNLTSSGCATNAADKSPLHNDHEIQSLHLINVLCDLFLRFGTMHNEKERQVVAHAINLVTNLPSSCLCELLLRTMHSEDKEIEIIPFEGHNVRILEILLRYLHVMLEYQDNETASYENISPVLTVLVKCARANRIMRHFIRSVVLPPLRNVLQRPEEGKELRNYLCRFLTSPDTVVRDLSAELLFICCKENVARMIKYTGYGNAAGLFAKRGVTDCRVVENKENDYSSDSEDSDTEEYKAVQNDINPVIGSYEPPKTNPLEGMSEERKEHEAMQLANLIDQLHRTGVMQPCRIGPDGKPQPVDHILQLQVELPQQQLERKRKS